MTNLFIMRSLHDVLEMNTYKADYVCLSAWFNSRTARRTWMKYDIDVMRLGPTLKSYSSISNNRQ
jgi:hypothetical protein